MAELREKELVEFLLDLKTKINLFYDDMILNSHLSPAWKKGIFYRKIKDIQDYEKDIIDSAILIINAFNEKK